MRKGDIPTTPPKLTTVGISSVINVCRFKVAGAIKRPRCDVQINSLKKIEIMTFIYSISRY